MTGVATMDAATAEQLVRMCRAVALLGARGVVVGIQTAVALSIVSLGVDLSNVMIFGNLRQALLSCMGAAR